MEMEGFKRRLEYFTKSGVTVSAIISDRHVSIQKFLRENYPLIKHYFDVWHVAKGINKKLLAVSKVEGYDCIRPWIPGIVSHLYWCAASTSIPGTIADKWVSMLNHIANKHENHEGSFLKCLHGPLLDHHERLWIDDQTKVHTKISSITRAKLLLKDIEKLSPFYQTSSVEAFHSVLLSKCPKQIHFFYDSMLGRNLLAALHYNENGGKEQVCTKVGDPRWEIIYPKAKGGAPVAKPVLGSSTYGYIEELLVETVKVFANRVNFDEITPKTSTLGTLSQKHSEGVQKEEVIAQHKTRFSNK